MDIDALKRLINDAVDQWAAGVSPTTPGENTEIVNEATVQDTNRRVVRTKSSGDRVYLIDEDKKTRQWVTNPDVLKSLGFEISDVKEVEDQELLTYNMGPALYRVENEQS